jgi:putative tricarboxylic transport membrane protein
VTTATRPTSETTAEHGFLRRRTGLIFPLLLLITGVTLGIGTAVMEIPENTSSPGPQFFPAVVAIACVVLAVLLGIDVLRNPEPAATATGTAASATSDDNPGVQAPTRPRSNHAALLGAVGTIVLFIVILDPLGWLISGAWLFWGVARALGSRRPVFDVFVSVAISSIVQLAFSAGLGLNLPPGILAGVI